MVDGGGGRGIEISLKILKYSDVGYCKYNSYLFDGRSWTVVWGARESRERGGGGSDKSQTTRVVQQFYPPTQSHSLSGELRTRHHG